MYHCLRPSMKFTGIFAAYSTGWNPAVDGEGNTIGFAFFLGKGERRAEFAYANHLVSQMS